MAYQRADEIREARRQNPQVDRRRWLIFFCELISVNTEMTDTMDNERRDRVCYDAECAICVRWANRFRTLLEGHGFTLIPLQSPIVRATLRIPHDELLAEMRVITSDGGVFGGADALLYITRVIYRPIFELTRIPGIKPLLRAAYRFIARNRTCSSGACSVISRKHFGVGNPADWLPLVLLPPAAAAIGTLLPGWLEMWLIAFTLFAGCKWLCYRRGLAKARRVSWIRKAGFLVAWIGMDTAPFSTEKFTTIPTPVEWLFAASKILAGSALLWMATRHALAINWLLGGWTGMVGIILTL